MQMWITLPIAAGLFLWIQLSGKLILIFIIISTYENIVTVPVQVLRFKWNKFAGQIRSAKISGLFSFYKKIGVGTVNTADIAT